MNLKFCKNCLGLLKQDNGKVICLSCKSEFLLEGFELSSKEIFNSTNEIAFVDEKASITLPKTEHICSRCSESTAYFWHFTSISDEADTIYYRCIKCGLTVQSGGQRGGR